MFTRTRISYKVTPHAKSKFWIFYIVSLAKIRGHIIIYADLTLYIHPVVLADSTVSDQTKLKHTLA